MTMTELRERYQLTLPVDVRSALRVSPGDRLDFHIGNDGEVRVRGYKSIPADQAWFWSEDWQAGEREVDESIAAGRMVRVNSAEEMDAFLDAAVASES